MRIYTSYFYQVRFFPPNAIPLSTAVWDPKWYHANKKQDHVFRDSRNVINGMRIPLLMPDKSCDGDCRGRENCKNPDPSTCDFLKHYRDQLDKINFQNFINELQVIASNTQQMLGFREDPIICLIVHEAPSNPCSERVAIQNWFQDNYYPISEWSRNS